MISLFKWQKEVFYDSKTKFTVVPAGRRIGKTQGAAFCAILKTVNGGRNLWVDTINANIDRYYERYFLPALKDNNLEYTWNVQKKLLKIGSGYIDFRSADRPESIEGFGYDNIFLNEAGIILNNDYLYTNSILPMLMDFESSQLFAFGTPKGKINKKDGDHRFWLLWQRVMAGDDNYSGKMLSSYDNPLLNKENVEELEEEIRLMNPDAVDQEIHGKFVDGSEDKLFNHNELNYFKSDDLRAEDIEANYGYIDVADQGTDFLCYIIGSVVDDKIYVTDVVYTQDNIDVTMPLCTSLSQGLKPEYIQVESNNQGAYFGRELQKDLKATTIIPIHNSSNKMTRIISQSGFIKRYFYFRTDYEVNSPYDLFMRNIFGFSKDKKLNAHDDAPDALSGLSNFINKFLSHKYE